MLQIARHHGLKRAAIRTRSASIRRTTCRSALPPIRWARCMIEIKSQPAWIIFGSWPRWAPVPRPGLVGSLPARQRRGLWRAARSRLSPRRTGGAAVAPASAGPHRRAGARRGRPAGGASGAGHRAVGGGGVGGGTERCHAGAGRADLSRSRPVASAAHRRRHVLEPHRRRLRDHRHLSHRLSRWPLARCRQNAVPARTASARAVPTGRGASSGARGVSAMPTGWS